MNDACTIVLFGATGDLTKRKLIPALFNIHGDGLLHEDTRIVAFARKPYTSSEYRQEMQNAISAYSRHKPKEKRWDEFQNHLCYIQGEFDQKADFKKLSEELKKIEGSRKANRVYYLAVPPTEFPKIVDSLKECGLTNQLDGWKRVVFEKPFGSDLKSAKDLNKKILKVFPEELIFRIDHYLGKELVQNMLVFRFANAIFERLWNKDNVDHVEIIVAEKDGIGTRAGYYDNAGALLDFVQNHLLQLLSLTAMEPPLNTDSESIHEAKEEVLKNLESINGLRIKTHCARGQYGLGLIDNKPVIPYREENGVKKNSSTETFAALKVHIDSERWKGVPFYLVSGKRLMESKAEIIMVFKSPCLLFCDVRGVNQNTNILRIRIQPNAAISLEINAKDPGEGFDIIPVKMEFSENSTFGMNTPEAYERLIQDLIKGDQTLFTSWNELENSWKFVDPIKQSWKKSKKIPIYPSGSWGPQGALELLGRGKKEGFWFTNSLRVL